MYSDYLCFVIFILIVKCQYDIYIQQIMSDTKRKCIFTNCETNKIKVVKPIKFHYLPRNREMYGFNYYLIFLFLLKEIYCSLVKWLKIANREDLIGKSSQILCKHVAACENHFSRQMYRPPKYIRLIEDAVPNQFQ